MFFHHLSVIKYSYALLVKQKYEYNKQNESNGIYKSIFYDVLKRLRICSTAEFVGFDDLDGPTAFTVGAG